MEEIKSRLIEKISQLQDEALLLALDQIVDRIPLPEVHQVTESEQKLIQLGLNDIQAGQTIDHDDLLKEEGQWFGE